LGSAVAGSDQVRPLPTGCDPFREPRMQPIARGVGWGAGNAGARQRPAVPGSARQCVEGGQSTPRTGRARRLRLDKDEGARQRGQCQLGLALCGEYALARACPLRRMWCGVATSFSALHRVVPRRTALQHLVLRRPLALRRADHRPTWRLRRCCTSA
jgi:hypothetical protein